MTDDPKLPCELVVGAGHFHKGVSVSTAQGAIDRMYARLRNLEDKYEPISEEARALFSQFKRATDGPIPAAPVSGPVLTEEQIEGLRKHVNVCMLLAPHHRDDFIALCDLALQASDALAKVEGLTRDVNELNDVLRAAGWGQGEIDSAAEMLYKVEERAQAAEAALKRKDGLLRELLPHLRAYGNHGIAERIQRELDEGRGK